MIWGTFSITHIISILLVGGVIVGLYYLLKLFSPKVQDIIMFILSLSGMAAIIWNLLMWNSPLEYLPLHMCSINAILLPIVILTKNKTLGNLLILWCVGALLAIVFNGSCGEYDVFSLVFAFYYFPHLFEFGLPILLFLLGKIKLEPKCMISTMAITLTIYTGVHFINVAVNNYFTSINAINYLGQLIQVNYMYSLNASGNFALQFFWNILPMKYWYMLLTFPIVLLVLFFIYLPTIIKNYKLHKQEVAKT
ncbi:MAG: YwaF family protein [Clostridia bacterium]